MNLVRKLLPTHSGTHAKGALIWRRNATTTPTNPRALTTSSARKTKTPVLAEAKSPQLTRAPRARRPTTRPSQAAQARVALAAAEARAAGARAEAVRAILTVEYLIRACYYLCKHVHLLFNSLPPARKGSAVGREYAPIWRTDERAARHRLRCPLSIQGS